MPDTINKDSNPKLFHLLLRLSRASNLTTEQRLSHMNHWKSFHGLIPRGILERACERELHKFTWQTGIYDEDTDLTKYDEHMENESRFIDGKFDIPNS